MVKSNDFLSEILSYGPSQGTFLLALKKMKEEGRSSEVVQACQKALSLYPDDLRLRTLLAESYLDLGFMGLAEAELATVTSGIGDLASAYKLQAELYTNQQRTEEAVGALNQYLVHKPDDHDARDLLEKIKPAVVEETPKAMAPATDFDHAEGKKPEEENIAEETIEKAPVPESPEISEDVNDSQKEELLESVVIPEDLAQVPEEDIEKALVPESPDVFEDAVASQEEDILDSVVIPEDITRALEEDVEEEAVVADLHDEPVDLETKDEFTDLATTELAEIYYNQGLISEAIHTYELALQSNPDDKASRERLAELKALNTGESVQQTGVDDIIRERKKRMITVLEEWKGRIQELSRV